LTNIDTKPAGGRRRKTVINIFYYMFGAAFLRGAAFFLIPVYTRMFVPEEYGRLILLLLFIGGTSILLGMGLHNLLQVEYFHHHAEERYDRVKRLFVFYTYIALPVAVLGVLLSGLISQNFFKSEIQAPMILLALLISFLTFYSDQYFTILKYQQNGRKLVSLQITVGLLEMLMAILFIYQFNLGILSVILARLIRTILPLLAVLFFEKLVVFKNWPHFTVADCQYYVKVLIPNFLAASSEWVLLSADRWIMQAVSTSEQIGIYSLAYSIAYLFQLLVALPLYSAYGPFLLTGYQDHGFAVTEKRNLKYVFGFLISALCLSFGAYVIVKPIFMLLVGEQYHSAYPYIIPVLVGYVFFGASYLLVPAILYNKMFNWNLYIFLTSMGLNIILNLIFIPHYGAWAAAFTTCFSYFVIFILLLYTRHLLLKRSSMT
jgi:O-antigen/teichoic acid export membrane protein